MAVCPRCGFGKVNDDERQTDYWSRTQDTEGLIRADYWSARQGLYRRALTHAARNGGPGRVADLGGGVGYFAACAIEMGWDAYSIDVSEHAVQAAAVRIGNERSFLRAPEFLTGTCDLVTLWCVVAHVPDPRAVLADALLLLKPGGRLVITTPNFAFQAMYAAVAARIGRPVDFVEHDHFLHFTVDAMDRLLAGVGLLRASYAYWGSTEDCVLEHRLAGVLVPCKRAWNWVAFHLTRAGLPPLYSELQVEAVLPAERGAARL
jgi:2-polyprenyl-3-methyl-5-hydroxy-6-metoxy-1,4-benzoquinol methylase